jgi:hypothetical protein
MAQCTTELRLTSAGLLVYGVNITTTKNQIFCNSTPTSPHIRMNAFEISWDENAQVILPDGNEIEIYASPIHMNVISGGPVTHETHKTVTSNNLHVAGDLPYDCNYLSANEYEINY